MSPSNDSNLRLLELQCCIVRMSCSVWTDEVIVRLAQETSAGMPFGFHANVMCLQSFVGFSYTSKGSVAVVECRGSAESVGCAADGRMIFGNDGNLRTRRTGTTRESES